MEMIRLEKEVHECLQGGRKFSLFVFSVNGRRVFASEDFSKLVNSSTKLANDGDAIILEWDRNSLELPTAGPRMDEKYLGNLRIRRERSHLVFESLCKDDATQIGLEAKEIWDKVVSRFDPQ